MGLFLDIYTKKERHNLFFLFWIESLFKALEEECRADAQHSFLIRLVWYFFSSNLVY